MTPHEIDAYWRSTYPKCEPIPYRLRQAYPGRWVRFHSLPRSQRYADDESEYRIILNRHNAVLDILATPNEPLVFVSTGYSESPEPTRDNAELNHIDPAPENWRTIAKHELDNDSDHPNYWHLFVSAFSWMPGVFDSILRLVADDVVANTMILSTRNHWVYHPYDGGADVVLDTTEARDTLGNNFKPWLSRRSDGL